MNFDMLPCDIKRMIFDCNRETAMREKYELIFRISVKEKLFASFRDEYIFYDCGEPAYTVDIQYNYKEVLQKIKDKRDESESDDAFRSESDSEDE